MTEPTARHLHAVAENDRRAAADPDPYELVYQTTSWSRWIDLGDALSGEPPPGPQICRWTDTDDQTGEPITRALFYPNEVHSVFGDPEAMKSWLLLHAAVQEIELGRHVFYLDMEANDRSIVQRLLLLGASPRAVRRFFHYSRPDESINPDDQREWKVRVQKYRPALVVLDGVTEAFSTLGLSVMSPEDTAKWFRAFSRRFQVQPTPDYPGPAIVELDHVVKDKEARNGWALGSIHKKAGIKGAAYSVVNVSPFGKGRHGRSRLLLEKDSPGGVAWVPFGKQRQRLVAELHCDATSGDGIDAYLETAIPVDGVGVAAEEVPLTETLDFRNLAHRIWKYVVDQGPCSVRKIRDNNTGTNDRIKSAVEYLADRGFIRNEGTVNKQAWVAVEGMHFDALQASPDGEA